MAIETEFAGAKITITPSIVRGTWITITLPSGYEIINANGWGDRQWDDLLADPRLSSNAADLSALTSLKASWDVLQKDYRTQADQALLEEKKAQEERDANPPPVVAKPAEVDAKTDPGVKAADTAPNGDSKSVQTNTESAATEPPAQPVATQQDDDPQGSGGGNGDNTTTTQAVNLDANLVNEQITPRNNVLDKYSSYTYRASVYLVTPQQYAQLLVSKKRTVSGYQLLFQSGGAPVNSGGFQGASGAAGTAPLPIPNSPDPGRSPAFPQDFYIESVTIENLIAGKATRAAHASSLIKFTVVEPLGITLVDRLYQAVQDFIPKEGAGAINYAAVTYLMVIRFYGYDENGNLIQKIGDPLSSDPNAVIEKFIPFRITKLNFRIEGKLVTYEIEGAPVGMMVAAGTRRGTIPYDVQLTAATVGELLSSNATYSDSTADPENPGSAAPPQTESAINPETGETYQKLATPPKADAAPTAKNTVKTGLAGSMNDFQKKLASGADAVYTYPDTYKVVFAKGAEKIRDAKLVLPGKEKEDAQVPMGAATTADAKSASPERVAKDISARNFSITAGMQIVQAIDLAIRNSSYIIDQALTIKNPITGLEEPNPNAQNKPVQWYNISFVSKQGKYDKLRNDYAFDVTFIISPYEIPNYNSKYFPVTKFRGVHKSYEYWFTGKNKAVLGYSEELNNLYNVTVTGSNPQNSMAERLRRELTSSMREIPFYTYQAASAESRQGSELTGLEPTANLAENLYSPTDLARTQLKIIGDPAWLQQGNFAGGVDAANFNYSPFLPDGTINFDAGQILFEVAWQRPQDYDLTTGLADPYSNRTNGSRLPAQSRVYQALKVVSEFNHGKFEQTIEGGLYQFIKPKATNKAAGAAVPDPANITREVAQRTGVDLSAAAGLRARSAFAASDPRRLDLANAGNPQTLPAPVIVTPPITEQNTGQPSPPAPPLTTAPPPAPVTDGTGVVVGENAERPAPKITDSESPSTNEPQTVASPDP